MCVSILGGLCGGGVLSVVAPENGVAFEQGSELADGGGAGFAPAHAGSFQALVDHGFAGGFDFSRADLPAAGQIRRVVGPMLIAPQITTQLARSFLQARRQGARLERFQFRERRRASLVQETMTLLRFNRCKTRSAPSAKASCAPASAITS